MNVIGLDLSSSTGYAVLSDKEELLYKGLIQVPTKSTNDYDYLDAARDMGVQIAKLIKDFNIEEVYIEQTNPTSHQSQKQLEFVHMAVLIELDALKYRKKTFYIHTSRWRSILQIRLSKEQKKHNAQARKRTKEGIHNKKGEGVITTKHLSVAWVNNLYNLKLLIQDNDIADAICVAVCGLRLRSKPKDIQDLDSLVSSW